MLLLLFSLFFPTLLLSQYTCRPNYSWNSTLSGCYPISPICSSGYSWDGRNCHPQTNCQNSTVWNGVQCVPFANDCPVGFVRWGTTCLNCPQGYRLLDVNQSCILDIKSCQTNQYWNGESCTAINGSNLIRVDQPGQLAAPPINLIQPGNTQATITNNPPVYQNSPGFSQLTPNTSNNNINNNNINNNTVNNSIICPTDFIWNGSVCLNNKTQGQLIQIVFSMRNMTADERARNGNDSTVTLIQTSTTIMQCLRGYYYNGRDCSPDSIRPFCVSGFSWNNSICINGSLLLNSTLNTINNYPSTLQNATNTASTTQASSTTQTTTTSAQNLNNPPPLITNLNITCPSGTYFNGVNCLPTIINNLCISGYDWNGSACIPLSSQSSSISSISQSQTFSTLPRPQNCPSGFDWNGQVCEPRSTLYNCLTGFVWNGTACASLNNSSPVGANSTRQCFSGYVLNGNNQCVLEGLGLCRNNLFFNGIACVSSLGNIQCAAGFVWGNNNTVCVPNSNAGLTTVSLGVSNTNTQVSLLPQLPPQTIVTPQPSQQLPPTQTNANIVSNFSTQTSNQFPSINFNTPSTQLPNLQTQGQLPPIQSTSQSNLQTQTQNNQISQNQINNQINNQVPPLSSPQLYNLTITTTNTTTYTPINNQQTPLVTQLTTLTPQLPTLSNQATYFNTSSTSIPGSIFTNIPTSNQNIQPLYPIQSTNQLNWNQNNNNANTPLVFISPSNTQNSNVNQNLIPITPQTLQAQNTGSIFPNIQNVQSNTQFTTTTSSQAGGWNQCSDSQYWNGRQCARYDGLMTCLPGYFWNWSTSRCG